MDKKDLELIIESTFDFDIKDALTQGWDTFRKATIYSISFTLLIFSLQFLFMFYAEDYLFIFTIFLAGPLFAGFYLVANKISRNEQVIYPDFFKGFRYYLPVVLVWLVGQVLTVLGLFALILPGVYLMVGYMFAVLISLFSGLDFWESLEFSRKVVHKKWSKFFIFGLVLALMNVLGAFAFGVGLVITIPVTYYAIYHVFEGLNRGLPLEEE